MNFNDEDRYLGATLSRRRFLRAAAAAGATGLLLPAESFGAPEQVHDLRGKVTINGRDATYQSQIAPGDRVVSGNDGYIVFAMGKDAYMLRSRSEFVIERREGGAGFLNLLTGALGAVFGRGGRREIRAKNVTAGIRGTGVYLETRAGSTYFCTCWGEVDLASSLDPKDRQRVASSRHVARVVSANAKDGTRFSDASFEGHTDEEMDILQKCVGRRSPIVVPGGDVEPKA